MQGVIGCASLPQPARRETEFPASSWRSQSLTLGTRGKNVLLPLLVRTLQRLTVRSVMFIRWLRVQLFLQPHHEPAIAALRQLYAVL